MLPPTRYSLMARLRHRKPCNIPEVPVQCYLGRAQPETSHLLACHLPPSSWLNVHSFVSGSSPHRTLQQPCCPTVGPDAATERRLTTVHRLSVAIPFPSFSVEVYARCCRSERLKPFWHQTPLLRFSLPLLTFSSVPSCFVMISRILF